MKVPAPFALQAATPSCCGPVSSWNVEILFPTSTFVLNTLTLKYSAYFSLLHPVYFHFVSEVALICNCRGINIFRRGNIYIDLRELACD